MGKFTPENMSEEVASILNSHVAPGNYYVDGTNGNDLNDGRTQETAWKTLKKLKEFISYKTAQSSVTINVNVGVYTDQFVIHGFNGNVRIRAYGEGEVVIPILKSASFDRINDIIIEGNIRFLAGEGFTETLCGFSRLGSLYIATTVTFEGGSSAFYSEHITAYIKAKFINQEKYLMDLSVQSDVVVADHIYNAKNNAVNLLCSAKYRSYHHGVGSKPETVVDGANSSSNLNAISNGIIIESGVNENGSYMKYADGTLICHHTVNHDNLDVQREFGSLASSASFIWRFPHDFLSDLTTKSFTDVNMCSMFLMSGIGDSATTMHTTTYKFISPYQAGTTGALARIALTAIGRWK